MVSRDKSNGWSRRTDRSMHLLYVTADERREPFLRTETAELRRQGARVDVFSLRQLMTGPGALPGAVAAATAAVPRWAIRDVLPVKAWPKSALAVALARRIARTVAADPPDHVHGYWASGPATAAMVAAQRLGVPFSFTAHRGDLVAGELLATKLRHAAFARAVSRRGAAMLRAAGDGRVEVIRVGIELPDSPRIGRDGHRLLVVGNLYPVKGHHVLVAAVRRLLDAGVAAEVDVVGDGPMRAELRRLTTRLPIRLLGALPHEDVLRMMTTGYAALVHPSIVAPGGLEEGVPVVTLEAGARGLPVVATTSGATGELVDEDTGWPVVPGDPVPLADSLRRVLAETDEAAERARRLRLRVAAEWDVRITAASLVAAVAGG